MNKEIMKAIFPETMKLIDQGRCPDCTEEILADSFKNELSKKEFAISGLCQKCQDEIFVEEL